MEAQIYAWSVVLLLVVPLILLVAGCLLAGFYLLRVHDMPTATWTAAAINLAAALLGFSLAALRIAIRASSNRPSFASASANEPK